MSKVLEPALFNFTKEEVPSVSDRVYAVFAPQTVTKPYIVFQVISNNFSHAMGGDDGLARTRVQFSVWGTGYGQVKGVVEELKAAYRNYIEGDSDKKMGMDAQGDGGHWVQTALLEDETDVYEQDTGLYGVHLDIIFWHKEED